MEKRKYRWTRGFWGKEENYPAPFYSFESNDEDHDGNPCIIEDNRLLKASDSDFGSYQGDGWEEYWDLILVPDNIIKIEDNAFENCINVSTVVLPNSVKIIGNDIFKGCVNLKYIYLPEKIEKIGENILNLWPNYYIDLDLCQDVNALERFNKEILPGFRDAEGHMRTFGDIKYIRWKDNIIPWYIDFFKMYNESCCNFKYIVVPNGCKEYYDKLLPKYSDYIIEQSNL